VNSRGKTPIFVYLAGWLRKSVLRLAVRNNSIPGRIVRRQRVPVFQGHRLPSTASRWDKRWVNSRGKTPIFVYLAWRLRQSVLRLAVRGNSIFARVFRRQRVPVDERHRLKSTGSRWDIG
jgi:tetraacyldisaccharide-1-P 4'-kinase